MSRNKLLAIRISLILIWMFHGGVGIYVKNPLFIPISIMLIGVIYLWCFIIKLPASRG